MALVDIDFTSSQADIPSGVADFLREADSRGGEFAQTSPKRATGFVPSDYLSVYRVLRSLADSHMDAGDAFCEWGSGLGVVTSLAAMLGYEAYGIEFEESLIQASRRLAQDFGLPSRFVHGSFIPHGAEASVAETYADNNGQYFWLVHEADNGYDKLGVGIDHFNIVFAYPWPGEEYFVEQLFSEHATPGALLLMYSDVAPFCVRQKVGDSSSAIGRGNRTLTRHRD